MNFLQWNLRNKRVKIHIIIQIVSFLVFKQRSRSSSFISTYIWAASEAIWFLIYFLLNLNWKNIRLEWAWSWDVLSDLEVNWGKTSSHVELKWGSHCSSVNLVKVVVVWVEGQVVVWIIWNVDWLEVVSIDPFVINNSCVVVPYGINKIDDITVFNMVPIIGMRN